MDKMRNAMAVKKPKFNVLKGPPRPNQAAAPAEAAFQP